jgi:hypothetical protein
MLRASCNDQSKRIRIMWQEKKSLDSQRSKADRVLKFKHCFLALPPRFGSCGLCFSA